MLVALMAHDKPQSGAVRQENRPLHIAYLKQSDAVVQAGPLMDPNGGMIGSLIILDMPDMDAAQAWADADPYAKAGLFASVTLVQWNKVIG